MWTNITGTARAVGQRRPIFANGPRDQGIDDHGAVRIPDVRYSGAELLGYVSYCRARAREVLTHVRDRQLRRRCPGWHPHAGKTFKALLNVNVAHVPRAWRPAGGLPGVRSGYSSVADATGGRGDQNRNPWRISEVTQLNGSGGAKNSPSKSCSDITSK